MKDKSTIFFIIACILAAPLTKIINVGIFEVRVVIIYLCLVMVFLLFKKLMKSNKEN